MSCQIKNGFFLNISHFFFFGFTGLTKSRIKWANVSFDFWGEMVYNIDMWPLAGPPRNNAGKRCNIMLNLRIVALSLLLSLPLQAELSTSRTLQLLDMRTRVISPITRSVVIRPHRSLYYESNRLKHRRAWGIDRRNNRYYRSRSYRIRY